MMANTEMNHTGRGVKVLLCAFLFVLLSACLLAGAAAADSEGAGESPVNDTTPKNGQVIIEFAGEDGSNLSITIEYDENGYFSSDAHDYNHGLAQASLAMAAAAFSSPGSPYAASGPEAAEKRYANLKAAYGKLGFSNSKMEFHNYDKPLNVTDDYVAYGIAEKQISVNGEPWTLLAVQLRGSGYAGEWVSNFHIDPYKIGDTQYSEGFGKPAMEIYDTLKKKLDSIPAGDDGKKKVKIWISGFSRAAAVSNALAGELTKHAAELGIETKDIYAYTFATPNAVLINPPADVKTAYKNIHNILNPCDIVPVVPMSVTWYDWNYEKYGTTHYYNYGEYDTDERSQITTKYQSITGDEYDPYTPKSGTAFLPVLFELCFSQTVAPDEYIADFYPYVEEMMSLVFCGEKSDATRLLHLNNNLDLLHPGDEKLKAAKARTNEYSEENEELDGKVLRFLISRAVEILWLFSDDSDNAVSNTASNSLGDRQGPVAQFTDGTVTIGFYQDKDWDDSDAFLGKAAELADNMIAEISALKKSGYDIKNITTITKEHHPEVYMSVLFSGINEGRLFAETHPALSEIHAIIYETNGGTMPEGKYVEIYPVPSSVPLSEKEPEKDGYEFIEWVDEDGNTITTVDIDKPGYTRVTAVWEKIVPIESGTAAINEWNIDKIETSEEGSLIVSELPSKEVTLPSNSILVSAVTVKQSESDLQYYDTPAVINFSIPEKTAKYLAELSPSYDIINHPGQVVLKYLDRGTWYNLKTVFDEYDKDTEKYLFHASTDELYSSFAICVDELQPPKKRSKSSQGTSIWLTATPTPTPTPEPTAEPTVKPTIAVPTVVPLPTTPTPQSPVPFAGVLAGLSAAAALFGLRRR